MSKKSDTAKNKTTKSKVDDNALRYSVEHNVTKLEANAAAAAARVEAIRAANKGTILAACQRAVDLYDEGLYKAPLNKEYGFEKEDKDKFVKDVSEFPEDFKPLLLIKGAWPNAISASRYQRLADKLKLIRNTELLEGQVAASMLADVPSAEEKVEAFKVLYPELICEPSGVERAKHKNDEPECHNDNVFEYDKAVVIAALEANIERRNAFDAALKEHNRAARKAAIELAAKLAAEAIDTMSGVASFNLRLASIASPETFGDEFDHPHAWLTDNLSACYFEVEQYEEALERMRDAENEFFTPANFNPNLLLPVPEFAKEPALVHVARIYSLVIKEEAIYKS